MCLTWEILLKIIWYSCSSDINFLKIANAIETYSNLAIIVTIFPKLENAIDIFSNF